MAWEISVKFNVEKDMYFHAYSKKYAFDGKHILFEGKK
jgi:hypothetical protein